MIPSAMRDLILSNEYLYQNSDAKVQQWIQVAKMALSALFGALLALLYLVDLLPVSWKESTELFLGFFMTIVIFYFGYLSIKTLSCITHFGQLNEPCLSAFIAQPTLPLHDPVLGNLQGLENVRIESVLDIRALYVQFYYACQRHPELKALTAYVQQTQKRQLCMYEAQQLLEHVRNQAG